MEGPGLLSWCRPACPLQPIKPGEGEGIEAATVGWSRPERGGFVTRVTRLRALLSAAREALREGEIKRADRIPTRAQLVAARLPRTTD